MRCRESNDSERGSGSFEQYEVWEHPLSENALGPCLYVGPLDPLMLFSGFSWFFFQLHNSQ